MTGTSNVIAVRGLIVTSFTPTPTGFTATFSKPFVNTTTSPIHLYNAASANYGAAEVTLVGPSPSTTAVKGSLIVNAANTGFTFIKTDAIQTTLGGTGGLLAAGTYTVTFVSGTQRLPGREQRALGRHRYRGRRDQLHDHVHRGREHGRGGEHPRFRAWSG